MFLQRSDSLQVVRILSSGNFLPLIVFHPFLYKITIINNASAPSELIWSYCFALTDAVAYQINTTVPTMAELNRANEHLQIGGRWQPLHCEQRQKIAVLIPFRDRWHQLPIVIRYLHLILVKQWRHYSIYVIEQKGNFCSV